MRREPVFVFLLDAQPRNLLAMVVRFAGEEKKMIDFMTICARKKLGNAEWQWCTSERVEGGFLVTGGVPGVYKSGKKKGRTKWPKKSECDRIIVTLEDRDAAIVEYEKETGKCAWCEGSGKTLSRWSRDRGSEFRQCEKCDGTGCTQGK